LPYCRRRRAEVSAVCLCLRLVGGIPCEDTAVEGRNQADGRGRSDVFGRGDPCGVTSAARPQRRGVSL